MKAINLIRFSVALAYVNHSVFTYFRGKGLYLEFQAGFICLVARQVERKTIGGKAVGRIVCLAASTV